MCNLFARICFSHMKIIKLKYRSTMTDNHLVASLRLAAHCYTSDYEKLASSQCQVSYYGNFNFSNSEIHLFCIWFIFSVRFISRSLLIKQIYVCTYVFKKGKVCDVTCEVWVVLRQQESVKLATAGWKRRE